MTLPLTATFDRAGKSWDLKDANGVLVGLIFLERDAKEIVKAINPQLEEKEHEK